MEVVKFMGSGSMTINQLRYFIEVARCQSFTHAANELFISQSALSKTIKLLEKELSVELIDRSSKGFKLTHEGRVLQENGERAIEIIEKQLNELYDSISLQKGKITVGIPPVIGTAYFTQIIYSFRNKYPDIELIILEEGANTVKNKVQTGEIDVGVVILPFVGDEFNITPVISSKNILLVHETHEFAHRKSVKFNELEKEKFISLNKTFMLHDRIVEICHKIGFQPNIICESSQWDFVAEMVSLNQGVAILPKPILAKYHDDKVKLIDLEEPEFPWNIAVIIHKNKYISTPIKLFLELVKEEGLKMV